jgi:hypothetical protein
VGSIVILAGVGTLTLNITYTVTAVFASLAGFALLAAAAMPTAEHWRPVAAGGVALVLVGALLRIPTLLLVLPMAAIGFVALFGRLKRGRLFGLLAAVGLLIVGTFGLDMLYVHASSEWWGYYAYSRARPQLHDTHRLNNLHNQIRRVGWTGNDQELFARWFYPDESRYSLENLQYLIDHTSPVSQDLSGSVAKFLRTLGGARVSPYLLWMAAISMWVCSQKHWIRRLWGPLSLWAAALALNLALTLSYKDPDYVLTSTLAGGLAFGTVLLALGWDYGELGSVPSLSRGGLRALPRATAFVILGLAAATLFGEFLDASSLNVAKQADYRGIRGELANLERSGSLGSQALIVSPAHGLPYEWSDPLKIDLPTPAYFDTGWITFSPSYDRVLREFAIDSLPEALLERNDVFLMTHSSFTAYLGRYYEEHRGIRVQFDSIYAMPNPSHLPGYDDIHIYKLRREP